MNRITLIAMTALLLGACATPQEDRCVEEREEIGFEDAAPWGSTAAEAIGHSAGERVGTIRWDGGGELGQLDPGTGQAALTITTTLDEGSVVAVAREHVGDGRLSCVDSFEMMASVTLSSDDGALQEQLELELVAYDGVFGRTVEGFVDLRDHAFSGDLSWVPSSDTQQLFLRMSWVDDQDDTARGWLIWGDAEETSFENGELGGSGVVRVLASFEATVGG